MIVHVLFAAALSLGAAATSPIQDVPAAQDKGIVVTGEANKLNKRVCKRSISTGSVMQKVTCKSLGEWNADTDRSVATLDRRRGEDRWYDANQSEKALLPPEGRPN